MRKIAIYGKGGIGKSTTTSNLASAVKNFGKRGYAEYSGVILNSRNVEGEEEQVRKALEEIGGDIVSIVPRSSSVQEAENQGKTVIEALPQSEQAERYRILAKKIIEIYFWYSRRYNK